MLLQPTVCQNHQSIVIIDTHYSVCISLVQFFLSFCHLFLPSFSFPYLVSLKPLLSKSFIVLVTSFHVAETKYLIHKMEEGNICCYSYHTLPTIVIILIWLLQEYTKCVNNIHANYMIKISARIFSLQGCHQVHKENKLMNFKIWYFFSVSQRLFILIP